MQLGPNSSTIQIKKKMLYGDQETIIIIIIINK